MRTHSTMLPNPALRAGLCALVLALGCADAMESAGLAAVEAQCASSSDCDPGNYCKQPHQLCVSADQLPQTVAIVAAPPSNLDFVPSQLASVTVSPDDELDVTLSATVRVTGSVRVEGNLADSSLVALITARPANPPIPSAPNGVQTSATEKDGYELILARDTTYSLTIRVPDTNFPVYRTEVTAGEDTIHDFWLPKPDTYPVVDGRVQRWIGDELHSLSDVQVTAVNVDTRAQCTSDTTDKYGTFELWCPAEPGFYEVLVSPKEDGPLIPSFTAVFGMKDNVFVEGDRSLSSIILPEQAREMDVSIQVIGPNGAVEGVSVTVSALLEPSETWTRAVLRRTAVTDNSGNIVMSVMECPIDSNDRPACTYTVTVSPLPNDPLSMQTVEGWRVADEPTLQIELVQKPRLIGTVVRQTGVKVGDAHVEARRTVLDPHTQTTTELVYGTETDADGNYSVRVDPGEYTVTVTPSISSGLPRKTIGPHNVGADGAALTVQLDRAMLLEGVIWAPGGIEPVANTIIDVYSDPALGPPTLLGTGQSEADGRYFVILPSAP